MSGQSIVSGDMLAVGVAFDTAWLGLLSWWVGSRIAEQDKRIAKQEAEIKALKKIIIAERRKHASHISDIIETLKSHDSRLVELEGGSTSNSRPIKTQQRVSTPSIRRVESESDESSVDDDDFSRLYGSSDKKRN